MRFQGPAGPSLEDTMSLLNAFASIFLAAGLPFACASGQEVRRGEQHVQRFERDVSIALREKDAADAPQRVIAETGNGSIVLESDPALREVEVRAAFKVDGIDEKDAQRRAETTRLFAERHSDGTIVVQVVFAGKQMPRDAADLTVRVPVAGDSSLKSMNGGVRARGTGGALKIVTRNGAIEVDRHAGAVDARTDNGELTLDGIGGGVQARTTNGAITVTLADGNDGPVDLESKNGGVELSVGPDFDGRIVARTIAGGITLVDPAKRGLVPERGTTSMTVELGSAHGDSSAQTSNGAIRITARPRSER